MIGIVSAISSSKYIYHMTTTAAENRGINGIYVYLGLQVPMIGCCVGMYW